MKPFCCLCKKTLDEIGGYLSRINAKGIDPVWACRPACEVVQTQEKNLLDAIQGDDPKEAES